MDSFGSLWIPTDSYSIAMDSHKFPQNPRNPQNPWKPEPSESIEIHRNPWNQPNPQNPVDLGVRGEAFRLVTALNTVNILLPEPSEYNEIH